MFAWAWNSWDLPAWRSLEASSFLDASDGLSRVSRSRRDWVDVKTGVAEGSFRVRNAAFCRRFRPEGEEVAAGLHDWLLIVYALGWMRPRRKDDAVK